MALGQHVPIARRQKQAQAGDAGQFALGNPRKKIKERRFPNRRVKQITVRRPPFLGRVAACSFLPTASCATRAPVSWFLYGNGKSDLWRRLFLGSGRNLSQIKRGDRYRGRLRRW